MTEEERRQMLELLESGREEFLAAVKGVTEEVARKSPAPGRWSILEVAEHVAAVERYLLSQVENARTADAPMVNEVREVMILKRGASRVNRMEAPEMARPSGRFSTLAAAVESFTAARTRTIEYVNASHCDQRSRVTTHPLIGDTNCWEMLLIIAVHPRRHAGQVREVLASAGSELPISGELA